MAIHWNKQQIFENLPILHMQLESILSANEDENLQAIVQNINEPLATYLALKDRVTATFEHTQNQIDGASQEDLLEISNRLNQCTEIIDSINCKISIAQSLIYENTLNNQNNPHEILLNEERKLISIQNENYKISYFTDAFTKFINNSSETNSCELFTELIDFYKELKDYSVHKPHYFNAENQETVASLLKQAEKWMQETISQQEEAEKKLKEQSPLEKLQCALATGDTNKFNEAFTKLDSADKVKLLDALSNLLLNGNNPIKKPLQRTLLGQLFSNWPGTSEQKRAAIEKILPPVNPEIRIQFRAEEMIHQMNDAIAGQTNNHTNDVEIISFENNNNSVNEVASEEFIVFVNFAFDENRYKIAICGSNIEGKADWDQKNPLYLANSDGCWNVQVRKETITEPISFKYVLVAKNGESLIWEKDLVNGPNRTIGDMTEPKF